MDCSNSPKVSVKQIAELDRGTLNEVTRPEAIWHQPSLPSPRTSPGPGASPARRSPAPSPLGLSASVLAEHAQRRKSDSFCLAQAQANASSSAARRSHSPSLISPKCPSEAGSGPQGPTAGQLSSPADTLQQLSPRQLQLQALADGAGSGGARASPSSPASDQSLAMKRWRRAVIAINEAHLLQKNAQTLADARAKPADRLYAAISLKLQEDQWARLLARNPHKALLRRYVMKKRAHAFTGIWDRIDTELYITGTLVFDWFTPARMGEHWPLLTLAYWLVIWVTFFFMAGQYPYFLAFTRSRACFLQRGDLALRCWTSAFPTHAVAYHGLLDAIVHSGRASCRFSFDFLRAWGGRYGPDLLHGQAYRWLTQQLVHAGFRHALANMLLFAALALQMEIKYGSWRLALVWLFAVVGGNLLSAATEGACVMVVGCSGGVFGLLGLFIADMLINWSSVRRPVLRATTICVFFAFFFYTLATQPSVSHMSHVGGLLCGLLPSFLILPRLGSERWEAAWPLLGLVGLLAWFIALPTWVYTRSLPASARCVPQ